MKLFCTSKMLLDCLELANRDDIEVVDELFAGEIGRVEGLSFVKTYESEFDAMPKIDTRKFSKCKKIRRQARGW